MNNIPNLPKIEKIWYRPKSVLKSHSRQTNRTKKASSKLHFMQAKNVVSRGPFKIHIFPRPLFPLGSISKILSEKSGVQVFLTQHIASICNDSTPSIQHIKVDYEWKRKKHTVTRPFDSSRRIVRAVWSATRCPTITRSQHWYPLTEILWASANVYIFEAADKTRLKHAPVTTNKPTPPWCKYTHSVHYKYMYLIELRTRPEEIKRQITVHPMAQWNYTHPVQESPDLQVYRCTCIGGGGGLHQNNPKPNQNVKQNKNVF